MMTLSSHITLALCDFAPPYDELERRRKAIFYRKSVFLDRVFVCCLTMSKRLRSVDDEEVCEMSKKLALSVHLGVSSPSSHFLPTTDRVTHYEDDDTSYESVGSHGGCDVAPHSEVYESGEHGGNERGSNSSSRPVAFLLMEDSNCETSDRSKECILPNSEENQFTNLDFAPNNRRQLMLRARSDQALDTAYPLAPMNVKAPVHNISAFSRWAEEVADNRPQRPVLPTAETSSSSLAYSSLFFPIGEETIRPTIAAIATPQSSSNSISNGEGEVVPVKSRPLRPKVCAPLLSPSSGQQWGLTTTSDMECGDRDEEVEGQDAATTVLPTQTSMSTSTSTFMQNIMNLSNDSDKECWQQEGYTADRDDDVCIGEQLGHTQWRTNSRPLARFSGTVTHRDFVESEETLMSRMVHSNPNPNPNPNRYCSSSVP